MLNKLAKTIIMSTKVLPSAYLKLEYLIWGYWKAQVIVAHRAWKVLTFKRRCYNTSQEPKRSKKWSNQCWNPKTCYRLKQQSFDKSDNKAFEWADTLLAVGFAFCQAKRNLAY